MSIHNILKNYSFLFILLVLVASFFFLPQKALARGGCFVSDTNVLTPKGEIPISQLRSGDSIVSLNTDTKQKEVSQINNVSVYKYNSYYLINGNTKVTSTHPFYVIRNGEFHIVEVQDLKVGDELYTDDNQTILINSIQVQNTPAIVYNLEDVSPNNDYFANDLLVHNKGGGGCFLATTKIDTPNGPKAVSTLKSGDKVWSWDDKSKTRQISTIGRIDIFEVDDYYLINNKIQVTGTHPFFVVTPSGTTIKQVSDLRVGDKLTNGDNTVTIESIQHLFNKATVYNLVNVTPFDNYFAEGILVHNKGGGGFGGGGSSAPTPYYYGGRSYTSSSSCDAILDPTAKKQCQDHFFWDSIGSLIGFIIVLPIYLLSYLFKAKSLFLRGKTFTNNQDLIEYTKKIVPKFTNTYDRYYSKDTENWTPMKPPPQVSPALYQNLATPDVLREKVQKLYERYESDWTNKDFEAMKSYIKEPYYSKQKQIFDSSFGDNFDVTYQPKILSATPLKVDLKIDGEYVKLQINGEMIDFEVSSSGTVLSGEPNVRGFTEYWQVFVDLDKNFYLTDIEN